MTAPNQSTQFYTDCKADNQDGSFLLVGSFQVRTDTAVSERCKHRARSWTEDGVLAMALHAREQKRNIAQTDQMETE